MVYRIFLIFVGFLVGCANYYALSKTINIMLKKKNIYFMFVSFFVRTCLILLVFYVFMQGSWQNVLFLLLGFILSKILSIYLAKHKKSKIEI